MTRYFFNLSDGTRERDEQGAELPDEWAAQRLAIRFAGEILQHEPKRLDRGHLAVDVSDQSDTVLFAIDISLREQSRG